MLIIAMLGKCASTVHGSIEIIRALYFVRVCICLDGCDVGGDNGHGHVVNLY